MVTSLRLQAGLGAQRAESRRDGEAAGETTSFIDVYERLRGAILRGDFSADQEISQPQLARELGISRTPLREVLRMLQREGLVVAQANRRLQVAGTSLPDLEQIYATRLPLEALAARFSVPRLDFAVV